MKVFVIIVTYKGFQWYERCFTSLRNSEYPVQTIVIDNASNDGTVEYIRENFPEIHLIESKENLGFGRANNIGMRYAMDNGCDYVCLLNQDAWIEPNMLNELVRVHLNYPHYGLLSPMHITAEKDHLNMLLNDGNYNYELLSDLYFGKKRDVYPISYVNAAAWLLPRDTIQRIGGFCPLFFYCGEDDDYMNRLRFHKIMMGLVPQVYIVHDSKNRLEGSKELANKAVSEGLHEIININLFLEPMQLFCYHLRKYVLSFFSDKKMLRSNHKQKLIYIFNRRKDLKRIRAQHKTIGLHWL